MYSRIADRCRDIAFSLVSGSLDQRADLRDSGGSAVVSPDARFHGRPGMVPVATVAQRPVSLLADLLRPLIENDPTPPAQRLIAAFGSLERTIGATAADLEAAGGAPTAAAIVSARALIDAALSERVERVPVDPDNGNLHKFLKRQMALLPFERLFAIFVDGSNGYLHSETLSDGTSGTVNAPMDQMMRRVRELRACGVLLAHNHPSGDVRPSLEDFAATRLIALHCARNNIALIGHLVIAGNRVSKIDCECPE